MGVDYSSAIDEPLYADAMQISRQVLEDFATGKVGEISIILSAISLFPLYHFLFIVHHAYFNFTLMIWLVHW